LFIVKIVNAGNIVEIYKCDTVKVIYINHFHCTFQT